MRVLVTGGAGFIGSHFTKMALTGELGKFELVRVLDKFTYSGLKSNLAQFEGMANFELFVGDISNPQDVNKHCEGIDAVVNFAAESHVDRSITNAQEFIKTNVDGVRVLLETCRDMKIRLIQVSTDEVYGSIAKGNWTESFPLEPNSPYSASKASGDMLARSFYKTFGVDVVITRCSNNYGPNQFPEKVIPLFITNLLEGQKVPLYGSGNNIRDWLHVFDHCRAIALALTKGRSGEIYNIGGGRELTNLELTETILHQLGFTQDQIDFVEDRKGHDLRYSVDWEKARIELGYEPQVTFEKGISETISWYKENQSWWKPLKDK
jgi:dTDP-glucose 4,6-dehydratase